MKRLAAVLLLCGCGSTPSAGLRVTGDDGVVRDLPFQTRNFHPRTKYVLATSEGAPGRMAPPRLEAGETSVVYLHHWQRAESGMADEGRTLTLLLVFDHIPQTPWRVELPAKGVEVVWHEEGKGTTTVETGWVQVDEAAARSMTVTLGIRVAGLRVDGTVRAEIK
jgi:hypothetical protein